MQSNFGNSVLKYFHAKPNLNAQREIKSSQVRSYPTQILMKFSPIMDIGFLGPHTALRASTDDRRQSRTAALKSMHRVALTTLSLCSARPL